MAHPVVATAAAAAAHGSEIVSTFLGVQLSGCLRCVGGEKGKCHALWCIKKSLSSSPGLIITLGGSFASSSQESICCAINGSSRAEPDVEYVINFSNCRYEGRIIGLKAADVDTNHAEFDGTRSKRPPLTEPAG